LSRLFAVERHKVSIVSIFSLIIGLLLYANQAVETRTLRLQSDRPLTFVQTLRYRGRDIFRDRTSFDETRLILTNDFDRGVIVDEITMVLLATKQAGYQPNKDCSLSDTDKRSLEPQYWGGYRMKILSVDGMRPAQGGYLLQGTAAIMSVVPTVEPTDAAGRFVKHEDERRSVAPGETIRGVRTPFEKVIEEFDAPNGKFRDGTAWACLNVALVRLGKPREIVTVLLGKVVQPFRPSSINTMAFITIEEQENRGLGDRDVERTFELNGPYSEGGIDLIRERSFNLLGPLEVFQ
jgi:hypothetical protein